jgi:hypothetical protein
MCSERFIYHDPLSLLSFLLGWCDMCLFQNFHFFVQFFLQLFFSSFIFPIFTSIVIFTQVIRTIRTILANIVIRVKAECSIDFPSNIIKYNATVTIKAFKLLVVSLSNNRRDPLQMYLRQMCQSKIRLPAFSFVPFHQVVLLGPQSPSLRLLREQAEV